MPEGLKLRENFRTGCVEVKIKNTVFHSNREYAGAAGWAQRTYNLSDAETLALYYPYKEDYDEQTA